MPVDLSNNNLRGKNFAGVDWHKAVLDGANLEETNLLQANLTKASLAGANLKRANMSEANLTGAKSLTVMQLREAFSLKGATLVDGTALPNSESWHGAFDKWILSVRTNDEGHILP